VACGGQGEGKQMEGNQRKWIGGRRRGGFVSAEIRSDEEVSRGQIGVGVEESYLRGEYRPGQNARAGTGPEVESRERAGIP
jgi:hypothetical protein